MNKYRFSRIIAIALTFFAIACDPEPIENDNDKPIVENSSTITSDFVIDIPSAISHPKKASAQRPLEDSTVYDGSVIYENLASFIYVGETSAEVIQKIVAVIKQFKLDKEISFTYVSDEDGRTKTVEIIKNITRNNKNYAYELLISDSDKSKALQMVWNESPKEGVVVLSPYDINRREPIDLKDTRYQVEFDEKSTEYDKKMIVSISDFPQRYNDKGFISNLKMTAIQTGDIIEVTGTSVHPEFYFEHSGFKGRSYCFVAKANKNKNIGIAKVGLPRSFSSSQDSIFIYDYEKILMDEIPYTEAGKKYGNENVANYVKDRLINHEAPAFFTNDKFTSSGNDVPSGLGFTEDLQNLSKLTPFLPNDISTIRVDFKE